MPIGEAFRTSNKTINKYRVYVPVRVLYIFCRFGRKADYMYEYFIFMQTRPARKSTIN